MVQLVPLRPHICISAGLFRAHLKASLASEVTHKQIYCLLSQKKKQDTLSLRAMPNLASQSLSERHFLALKWHTKCPDLQIRSSIPSMPVTGSFCFTHTQLHGSSQDDFWVSLNWLMVGVDSIQVYRLKTIDKC